MPSLRETIAAAMESSGYDPEAPTGLTDVPVPSPPEGEAAPEVTDPEATGAPEAPEQVDGDAGRVSEGITNVASEATEDVPTEYYGLDLSDLPPEARLTVINRLKDQDKLIQQEKRKNAELAREEQQSAEDQPELTSDDIMEALGYSRDDPMYDVKAEVAGPLAQRLIAMETAFSQFVQQEQLERLASHWDGTLDYMEGEYGKLPMTREEVFEYAADNGIMDPQDAYNRIAVPGRKRMSAEVEKAKAEALRNVKAGLATPRPSTGDAGSSEPTGNLSPREAAIMAAKQTGIDWGDALKATR